MHSLQSVRVLFVAKVISYVQDAFLGVWMSLLWQNFLTALASQGMLQNWHPKLIHDVLLTKNMKGIC
jgi:hypothetical protein